MNILTLQIIYQKNIKIILSLILFFTSYIFAFNGNKELNLMPMPVKVNLTGGEFRIDSSFTVMIKGNLAERLSGGVNRMLRRLSDRTGIFLLHNSAIKEDSTKKPLMVISVEHPGKLKLGEDESYILIVKRSGIILTSNNDIGALRGIETFLQLLKGDSTGYFFPCVVIKDFPRFQWRGLMIDVARHFMPVNVIERNIDGMASVKLNVLHLHLSDDQGFRVESKTFPKLTGMGSDGLFYTHEQIKEIIKYANDRGIRVEPEFDLPGHATSWFVGYPQYASISETYSLERKFGQFDPTFDPTNPKTYLFLDKFFKEMSDLFPDEYIHIGGDENNGKQWNANPKIQAFMKRNNLADDAALQNYFNCKLLEILKKYHKKMIGWDEILTARMPKDIVIQSWRGPESLKNAATKGYNVILSSGYYLDLCLPASYHYKIDPVPDSLQLSESQRKYILGGEACMWSEFVSNETIDSRIWPRAAAIAERFWSPQNVRDVKNMYKRLDRISYELEDLGLAHIKNQAMMIRRLADYHNVNALTNFINVIEPVKNYNRFIQEENCTSFSPLTRVVDAAVPDPEESRYFAGLVNNLLDKQQNDTVIINKIKSLLTLWQGNDSQLEKIIKHSPVLREIKPLSEKLSLISAIGLKAIDFITANKKADDNWLKESLLEIKKSEISTGEVELRVIQPIDKLILAAAKAGN